MNAKSVWTPTELTDKNQIAKNILYTESCLLYQFNLTYKLHTFQ